MRQRWIWKGLWTVLVAAAVACGSRSHDSIVIPSTTKVLDGAARELVARYAPDGTIVAARSTFFDRLAPGDVMVSGAIPGVAPQGFLKRVTSTTRTPEAVTIHTEPAALADAVHRGALEAVTPVGYDDLDLARTTTVPGVTVAPPGARARHTPQATGGGARHHIPPGHGMALNFDHVHLPLPGGPGITLTGTAMLDVTVNASVAIDFFSLRQFLFTARIDVDSDVTADGTFSLTAPASIKIADLYLAPIVFTIGPVPVLITNRLTIFVGASTTGRVNVTAMHVTNSSTAQAGTSYTPTTGWVDQSYSDGTGALSTSSLPEFGVELELSTRVEARSMLYDVIGPFTFVETGLVGNAELSRHPFFKAGVHLKAGIGGTIDVYITHISIPANVLDRTFWFFETGNLAPIVNVTSPASGLMVAPGVPIAFRAEVVDLDDGRLRSLRWRSDIDGDLGTTTSFSRSLAIRPGPRTITVTATDPAGATTERSLMVNVVATQPVIEVISPRAEDTVYFGDIAPVAAHVTDAFFPDADPCSLPGFIASWSSDAGDQFAAPAACATEISISSAPGPHTLTLQVTDPFGGAASGSVVIVPQLRPPGVFQTARITTPTSGEIFELGTFLAIRGEVAGPPEPTEPITYTWTATSYKSNGSVHVGPVAIGTGPAFTWDPARSNLIDFTAAGQPGGQRFDINMSAIDQRGNTSAPGVHVTIYIHHVPG